MHYFDNYTINVDVNNLPDVSSDNLSNIIKLLVKDDMCYSILYTIVNNNGINDISSSGNMQTLRYNIHNYVIMKTMMKASPNDIVVKNAFSTFVDAQKSQKYQLSELNSIIVQVDGIYSINDWVPVFNYKVTIDSVVQREWTPLSSQTKNFISFWYKVINHWLVLLKQNEDFVKNYHIKADIIQDILLEVYGNNIDTSNDVFYNTIYMILDRVLQIMYPLKLIIIKLQLPSYYTFMGIILYILIELKDLIIVLNNTLTIDIIDINNIVLI